MPKLVVFFQSYNTYKFLHQMYLLQELRLPLPTPPRALPPTYT